MTKLKMTISMTCVRDERELEARAIMGIVLDLVKFMNKDKFQLDRYYEVVKTRRPSKRKPKSKGAKNGK